MERTLLPNQPCPTYSYTSVGCYPMYTPPSYIRETKIVIPMCKGDAYVISVEEIRPIVTGGCTNGMTGSY